MGENSLLIPPLIGFFAKQQVLYAATHTGYYFLAILAILVSVISASYYLKIVKVIHFDAAPKSSESNLDNLTANIQITNIHSYVIATFTLIILFFMLNPELLLNSTQLLALSLFNY